MIHPQIVRDIDDAELLVVAPQIKCRTACIWYRADHTKILRCIRRHVDGKLYVFVVDVDKEATSRIRVRTVLERSIDSVHRIQIVRDGPQAERFVWTGFLYQRKEE